MQQLIFGLKGDLRKAVFAIVVSALQAFVFSSPVTADPNDNKPEEAETEKSMGSFFDLLKKGGQRAADREAGRTPAENSGSGESGKTSGTTGISLPSTFDDLNAKRSSRPIAINQARATGFGLLRQPATEEYLNEVMKRILDANQLGHLDIQVKLHSSREQKAWATPDGTVFVSLAIARRITNEVGLAFLLAHEAAHCIFQHHDSDWFVNSQGLMLSSTEAMRDFSRSTVTQMVGSQAGELNSKIRMVNMAVAAGLDVSEVFLHPAWTREQEHDSDMLAMQLIAKAGYDPLEGGTEFLAAVQEAEEKISDEIDADTSNTANSLTQGAQSNIELIVAMGLGNLVGALKKEFGSDHYSAEARIADVEESAEKSFPEFQGIDFKPAPWDAADHPLITLFEKYRLGDTAEELRASGDLAGAERVIRKAVTGETQYDPYLRYVFYQIRKSQRKPKKAMQNLKLIEKSGDVPFKIVETLLDDAERRRDWKSAISLLDRAEEDYGATPQLLPHKIYIYAQMGDKQKAKTSLSICQIEHRQMLKTCNLSANGHLPGAPMPKKKGIMAVK